MSIGKSNKSLTKICEVLYLDSIHSTLIFIKLLYKICKHYTLLFPNKHIHLVEVDAMRAANASRELHRVAEVEAHETLVVRASGDRLEA